MSQVQLSLPGVVKQRSQVVRRLREKPPNLGGPLPRAQQMCHHYYRQVFRGEFYSLRAMEFQHFVERILLAALGDRFEVIRPMGPRGDWKCDGLIADEGAILQVYAPERMSEDETVKKAEDAYSGGKRHWGAQMKKWVFVMNEREGLPAPVRSRVKALLDADPDIEKETWGLDRLWDLVWSLNDEKLRELLGPYPLDASERLPAPVAAHLHWIFGRVKTPLHPTPPDLRPVHINKLMFNNLTGDTASLLAKGLMHSGLVDRYFEFNNLPEERDEIAEGLRQEYTRLHDELAPLERESDLGDRIFADLQLFLAEHRLHEPRFQSAVLTVLAYFFTTCDIFERPPDDYVPPVSALEAA